MELHTVVGSIASFLTTIAFFPQVWKTIRTRETRAISLGMYAVFTSGVVLWFCYGVMIDSWPIIVGNVVTFACAAVILAMKIRLG